MPDSRLCLDGTWEFLHIADDRMSGPAEVREIKVPSPWQAQVSDLRMRAGIGIYRRTVTVPAEWIGEHVWIRFGAVFHNTKVFVNGELVGSNEGGFLPFSFEVTRHLRSGENEIKVRVDSPTDNPVEFPDSPFAEIPFGKQSWYGPLSGIWQSVHLERRIPDHIVRVRLVPNRETGKVVAGAFFANPLVQATDVAVELFDPAGERLPGVHAHAMPGVTSVPFEFQVGDVKSWSPDVRTSTAPASPCAARARRRMRSRSSSASAPSRRAVASSTSMASRSTSELRSTRIITPRPSAPCPRSSSSRTSSARPRSLA